MSPNEKVEGPAGKAASLGGHVPPRGRCARQWGPCGWQPARMCGWRLGCWDPVAASESVAWGRKRSQTGPYRWDSWERPGQEMRAEWPRPAPGPLQPQLHLLRASLGPLWVMWCVKVAPPPWACSSAGMGRVPDSFWPRLRAIFTDSPQKDSGFAKALEGGGQQEADPQGAGRPGKAGAQHMGAGVH